MKSENLLILTFALNIGIVVCWSTDHEKELEYLLQIKRGNLDNQILQEWLINKHPAYWNFKEILRKMHYLDLEFFHIQNLAPGVFSGMNELNLISLANNRIKQIDGNIFENVANLEKLIVHNNQISLLDGNILNGKNKLWFIDFENNKIDSLKNGFIRKFNAICVTEFYFFNNRCGFIISREIKVIKDAFTEKSSFKFCIKIKSTNCKLVK